jgi:CubicO group peptidase (beta-lactamase class C family)
VVHAFDLLPTWPVENVSAVVIDRSGEARFFGDETREYRLASVTKLITAWAILVGCEEGTVSLDDVVSHGDPVTHSDVTSTPKAPIHPTLRHLLAHAGGYPFEGDAPVARVGDRRIYSNIGYEIAARHLANAAAMPFWDYVEQAVFEPLGISGGLSGANQSWSPAKDAQLDIVQLSLFVAELRRPRLLARETFVDAVTPQFPDLEGVVPGIGRFDPCPWGLGPELRGDKRPHWMSMRNSAATYGHFGGSGTFVWVDPLADVSCAVLTDRSFDQWAMSHWPEFSSAVLDEFAR